MAAFIRLTEGDEVTYTITVKRAGTAVNLAAYTVVMYVHDDDAAFGTNQINGASCSIVGDGSAGQVTFAFTSTHTSLGTTNTDFKGKWALKLTTATLDEWTDQEPITIRRNPFITVAS